MRHLPNLLTLANLFCGCIAISFTLAAQNFHTEFNLFEYVEVPAVEQPYWGTLFIFLAAVFDLLDGWAARALKIYSPIGKDLDSLADIVSFGVAPSMMLFKQLWAAHIIQPEAMDVSLVATTPAFIIACVAAIRLARFNQQTKPNPGYFTGLPTPAAGMVIASIPLLVWQNPLGMAAYLYKPWVLYTFIAIMAWLMISRIKFVKFIPTKHTPTQVGIRAAWIVLSVVSIFYIGYASILFSFILYIIVSHLLAKGEDSYAEEA